MYNNKTLTLYAYVTFSNWVISPELSFNWSSVIICKIKHFVYRRKTKYSDLMKNIICTVYKNYIILSFILCLNLKISSKSNYVALGNSIIMRFH